MRKRALCFGLSLAIALSGMTALLGTAAFADDPPANNTWSGAVAVNGAGEWTGTEYLGAYTSGDSTWATADGEPSAGIGSGAGLWYKFRAFTDQVTVTGSGMCYNFYPVNSGGSPGTLMTPYDCFAPRTHAVTAGACYALYVAGPAQYRGPFSFALSSAATTGDDCPGEPSDSPDGSCAVTGISGALDGSSRVGGSTNLFGFTFLGTASAIVMDPDFLDPGGHAVVASNPTSPATLSVTWPRTGAYSTDWRCYSTNGLVTSSGAFGGVSGGTSAGPARPSIGECVTQSTIGLLPTTWVPAAGAMAVCLMKAMFYPSSGSVAGLRGLWGSVQAKAPFSFAYDVLAFLPTSIATMKSAVDAGPGCGAMPTPTEGHLVSDPGGTIAGRACTQSGAFAPLRALVLFIVVGGLCFALLRTTLRVIG